MLFWGVNVTSFCLFKEREEEESEQREEKSRMHGGGWGSARSDANIPNQAEFREIA